MLADDRPTLAAHVYRRELMNARARVQASEDATAPPLSQSRSQSFWLLTKISGRVSLRHRDSINAWTSGASAMC